MIIQRPSHVRTSRGRSTRVQQNTPTTVRPL
jgi:hypothetical protein